MAGGHCEARILYSGETPGLDTIGSLAEGGLEVQRGADPPPMCAWIAMLSHPAWGKAVVTAPREPGGVPPLSPEDLSVLNFTRGEQERALGARNYLSVVRPDQGRGALGERKALMWFVGAVMGPDAVAVYDMTSTGYWAPGFIADELAHDADLDILSAIALHPVLSEDGSEVWVHTHGLGALGGFDLDFFLPVEDVRERFDRVVELTHALCSASVDGRLATGPIREQIVSGVGPRYGATIDEFKERGAPRYAAMVGPDEAHRGDRIVLCAPPKKPLFGKPKVQPEAGLTLGVRGVGTVAYSSLSADRMGERARATMVVGRKLFEEFRDIGAEMLVKLGLGDAASGREYAWFRVVMFSEEQFVAELASELVGIALPVGSPIRGEVDETFFDWLIGTPAGTITPRDFRAAGMLRALTPETDRPAPVGGQDTGGTG